MPSHRALRVPITQIAEAETGRRITASMVGLGLIGGLTGVVSRAALEKAVADRVPAGTEEINLKALAAGFDKAESIRAADRYRDPGNRDPFFVPGGGWRPKIRAGSQGSPSERVKGKQLARGTGYVAPRRRSFAPPRFCMTDAALKERIHDRLARMSHGTLRMTRAPQNDKCGQGDISDCGPRRHGVRLASPAFACYNEAIWVSREAGWTKSYG